MWKDGTICGIQRRFPNGNKQAIHGSINGVFLPMVELEDFPTTLIICEGASDAIYMDTHIQFPALVVGKQNCDQIKPVVCLWLALQPKYTIIVADNDEPGRIGAKNTAFAIRQHPTAQNIRIFVTREKDVRETLDTHGEILGSWC
jgi:phage/plasmid primase-like uncharacterized protein